jgi:small subunit ribosomal protein S5
MEEVKKQENTTQSTASASAPIKDGAVAPSSARPAGRGGFNDRRGGAGAGRGGSGAGRRPGGPSNKPFVKKDEFQEQTLDMRRVTRVMAGGKRFRFRATIVIGDLRGRGGREAGGDTAFPRALA